MATANRETSTCHSCGGVLNQFLLKSCWRVQKLSPWINSSCRVPRLKASPPSVSDLPWDKGGLINSPLLSVHVAPIAHFPLSTSSPCSTRDHCQSFWQLNGGLLAFKAAARVPPLRRIREVCWPHLLAAGAIRIIAVIPSEEARGGGGSVKRANLTSQRLARSHTHTLQTCMFGYVCCIKMANVSLHRSETSHGSLGTAWGWWGGGRGEESWRVLCFYLSIYWGLPLQIHTLILPPLQDWWKRAANDSFSVHKWVFMTHTENAENNPTSVSRYYHSQTLYSASE